MSIISVIICNKSGKILLSRSFEKVTKYKLEGLVLSFPKLIDKNQQHTYVETENYRYVYTLLGADLYLLLLTNKKSNIIEDISLLRTLYGLTLDKLVSFDENELVENGFELLFLYDECISAGHGEMLTNEQVNTIIKMESHEENLHDMIVQNQIKVARKKAKKKEKEIAEILKFNQGKYTSGIESRRVSPGGMQIEFASQYGNESNERKIGSLVGGENEYQKEEKKNPFKRPKALKLGSYMGKMKSVKSTGLLQEMGIEENIDVGLEKEVDPDDEKLAESPKIERKSLKHVLITMSEVVSCEIDNKDEETSTTIKGTLEIQVNDKNCEKIQVKLEDSILHDVFKFQQHPKTDKTKFSEDNIIQLKDKQKGYKVGSSLKVLQWRLKKKTEESIIPINLTCWPNEGSQGMTVSLEFDIENEKLDLHDLNIRIPVPENGKIEIDNVEVGTYRMVSGGKGRAIIWSVPPQYKKGNLEFSIDDGNESSFFPIHCKFHSKQLLSGIKVKEVKDFSDRNMLFDCEVSLTVQNYALLN